MVKALTVNRGRTATAAASSRDDPATATGPAEALDIPSGRDKLPPVELLGIHHVKYPVSDLRRSRAWYSDALGLELMQEFVEEGVVRGVALRAASGAVVVALREAPQHAGGLAGFDPVAFLVEDRAALAAWADHFESLGIDHGPLVEGSIGWMLEIVDPDGIHVRLYTKGKA